VRINRELLVKGEKIKEKMEEVAVLISRELLVRIKKSKFSIKILFIKPKYQKHILEMAKNNF